MLFAPCLDILEPALVDALPLGMHFQGFGGGCALQDLIDTLFQPPLVILKRKIKHIALYGLHLAKHEGVASRGEKDIKRYPPFAFFWLASDDGNAFWNKLRKDDAHRGEGLRLQALARDHPVPPCLGGFLSTCCFLRPCFFARI